MMAKEKQKTGDKFRQRIAFNLAKECLLGYLHNPSLPQEDLFMDALDSSKFASRDGDKVLDVRTYKSGWYGKQRPQRWLQSLLDEIVQEYAVVKLSEWQERITLDKSLHERKLQAASDRIAFSEGWLAYSIKNQAEIYQLSAKAMLEESKKRYEAIKLSGDYGDGLHVSYFPGVDIKPSHWIHRAAINDVLHDHFCAFDVMAMDYSPNNILACNKFLTRIHERWDPYGGNSFFEFMEFSHSDFIYRDEADYAIKVQQYNRKNSSDELDTAIIEKFIIPDNIYELYDVFSPAKISEFLTKIPISKDISNHPLLDFWVLDFASSIAAFDYLYHAYQRRDGYKISREISIKSLDIMAAGRSLLWEDSDIRDCLSGLDIYPRSAFYQEYHEIFSLIRSKYYSILNRFGINFSEIKELLDEFDQKNVVVFVPSRS